MLYRENRTELVLWRLREMVLPQDIQLDEGGHLHPFIHSFKIPCMFHLEGTEYFFFFFFLALSISTNIFEAHFLKKFISDMIYSPQIQINRAFIFFN